MATLAVGETVIVNDYGNLECCRVVRVMPKSIDYVRGMMLNGKFEPSTSIVQRVRSNRVFQYNTDAITEDAQLESEIYRVRREIISPMEERRRVIRQSLSAFDQAVIDGKEIPWKQDE